MYGEDFILVTYLSGLHLWEKTCGQSYKHFTLVNYNSRVVIWGNFKSGMTLE